MSERKLDIAKRIIKEYYDEACLGIFDSRSIVGDPMNRIYDDGELSIDICYHWSFFEVFGLSNDDFTELKEFYEEFERDYPECVSEEAE